ncbi:chromate transporter [Rhodoferax koreense]|uniref:Chromate transporter n=1 Tax=Rhodoferax koreensis TaxID=1842727 RepID=A0A1P8JSJ7_9BURK|nr:chromate transporter [Rhodoferax koreense]APW36732.1 chromate transporter [Rhodoferax koreense]
MREDLRPAPGLRDIFTVFSKIGLTSFGGGLSGWILREVVQRRGWLGEQEFLSGLALAQAFPGVNVVNLAIWIGYRLRGGWGAFAAAAGIVVPPMAVAILLAAAFSEVGHSQRVHVALGGIAAAAVGLSLQTGLRAARHAARGLPRLLILATTFAAIFFWRLPLLWVVGVMAPLSIGLAWLRIRNEAPLP